MGWYTDYFIIFELKDEVNLEKLKKQFKSQKNYENFKYKKFIEEKKIKENEGEELDNNETTKEEELDNNETTKEDITNDNRDIFGNIELRYIGPNVILFTTCKKYGGSETVDFLKSYCNFILHEKISKLVGFSITENSENDFGKIFKNYLNQSKDNIELIQKKIKNEQDNFELINYFSEKI